ncbi:hypothetical protein AB0E78_03130 [Streptomyces sp. NPDC032198]|uniref:hypothetical protein n=1 Tax=Streptomyces sp. NPDC032198 TaxID=3155127 RepID=UPI0033F0BFFB
MADDPPHRLGHELPDRRAPVPATTTSDLARAAWAFAHGMVILEVHGVILEVHGRFPGDAELATAWKRGARALHP